MMIINSFRGEYEFLSNFFPCEINIDGFTFKNAEAAFQSSKVLDDETRKQFCSLNPSDAKRLGRKVKLRPDWEEVKYETMFRVVKEKFFQNEHLAERLRQTLNAALIEGNDWGDKYWGMCGGEGYNKLGYILMYVRAILNDTKS